MSMADEAKRLRIEQAPGQGGIMYDIMPSSGETPHNMTL